MLLDLSQGTCLNNAPCFLLQNKANSNNNKFCSFYRYLNNRMILYDTAFHVEPLMSSGLAGLQWPIGTILSVNKTNSVAHDGNYTCAPSTLTTDSILIHIIDEGKIPPAAVYGDSSNQALNLIQFKSPILILCYLLILPLWYDGQLLTQNLCSENLSHL